MGYNRRFNPYACIPCETRAASCACCDFSGDTARFLLRVYGCEGFAGVQDITSIRTCPPAELPAGVTYPSTIPCCVWPFSVGTGDGCVSDEVSWGGSIYVVLYCDGEGYKFDVYCFDTDLGIWVLQAEGVNAPHRCLKGCENFEVGDEVVTLCCTFVVDITLPELDCCCPEEEGCCDPPLGEELTAEIEEIDCISGAVLSSFGVYTLTRSTPSGGFIDWVGPEVSLPDCAPNNLTFECDPTSPIGGFTFPTIFSFQSGTCEPEFEAIGEVSCGGGETSRCFRITVTR